MTLRRRRVQWTLTLFAATMLGALLVVAGLSFSAIATSHRLAVDEARADLAALEDAGLVEELLYQKGFIATYFLTHDPRWLDALREARPTFERRLERMRNEARVEAGRADGDSATLLATAERLGAEYRSYDAARDAAVDAFHRGDEKDAIARLLDLAPRVERLRDAATQLLRLRRAEVEAAVARAEASVRRALVELALAALLALVAAALVGWSLARRVTRPLYELVLRAESAGASHARPPGPREGTGQALRSIEISASDEIGAIGEHVARLAAEIEASSVALAEQRRRLAQAEKMSALGEVATAVAHQVLNPLCGMKTALQLLARARDGVTVEAVRETVAAVDGEIRRVEGMARRLMSFARPLAPSVRATETARLLAEVAQAVRAEALAAGVTVETDAAGLPTLEADPELLVELLVNLATNGCQAIGARGGQGRVHLVARRDGEWRLLEVGDDGAGLSPDVERRLFQPFVTTRPGGHGLGLAVAENIALAHGGRLEARANADGRGTTFTLRLPARTVAHVEARALAPAIASAPLRLAAHAEGK